MTGTGIEKISLEIYSKQNLKDNLVYVFSKLKDICHNKTELKSIVDHLEELV